MLPNVELIPLSSASIFWRTAQQTKREQYLPNTMTVADIAEKEDLLAFNRFAADIDAYCRQRYGFKRQCIDARHPTVDVHRAAVNLYLRFRVGDSWRVGSVVIAVIRFREKRRGHGTALLGKLVEMAPMYGYQNIEVEQTGSDISIQSFVRKFGFTNTFDERNWIVPVGQLRELLASMR
jgi:GNAT superfamily N-acetyltransferase